MSAPEKLIQDESQMNEFHKTQTYKKYFTFIERLQEAVKSTAISETPKLPQF